MFLRRQWAVDSSEKRRYPLCRCTAVIKSCKLQRLRVPFWRRKEHRAVAALISSTHPNLGGASTSISSVRVNIEPEQFPLVRVRCDVTHNWHDQRVDHHMLIPQSLTSLWFSVRNVLLTLSVLQVASQATIVCKRCFSGKFLGWNLTVAGFSSSHPCCLRTRQTRWVRQILGHLL